MRARFQRLLRADKAWLVLSAVGTKASSAVIGLLIARSLGISEFGMYAASVNVASFLSNPFVPTLQFNATLLSGSRHDVAARRALFGAHVPVLLSFVVTGLVGFAVVAPLSGLPDLWERGHAFVWAVAISIFCYQLLGSVALGALQGVGDVVQPARWRLGVALVAMILAFPLIGRAGLNGAYLVLAFNSLLHPVVMLWFYLRPKPAVPPIPAAEPISFSVLARAYRTSVPTVLTTLLLSGADWFCLVFLVSRAHGPSGLGWVSLGMQWAVLLLTPVSSWNGLVLARLKEACDTGQPVRVRQALRRNLLHNAGLTCALAAAVAIASPLIATIYKVPEDTLGPLLLVSGIHSILFGATSVYELLFFCQGHQATWMLLSVVAGVVRCVVTAAAIPYSFLMAPGGSAVASLLLLVIAWLAARRLPAMRERSERTNVVPEPIG